MAYSKILKITKAEGVMEYDQALSAGSAVLDIGKGACLGLSATWLKAKKTDRDYWRSRGTIEEPLLNEHINLEEAIKQQKKYSRAMECLYILDDATKDFFQRAGMEAREQDCILSMYDGGNAANNYGFANQALGIATQVLSADSRFYILGAWGRNGGHAIALYRPYKLVGKSSDCYVFDPNIGEFKVTGTGNLASLLRNINTEGYKPLNMDINGGFILWSFFYDPIW